jgi:hypothetical protein
MSDYEATEHPDYKTDAKRALPTLDERLDVPDAAPTLGERSDIIADALSKSIDEKAGAFKGSWDATAGAIGDWIGGEKAATLRALERELGIGDKTPVKGLYEDYMRRGGLETYKGKTDSGFGDLLDHFVLSDAPIGSAVWSAVEGGDEKSKFYDDHRDRAVDAWKAEYPEGTLEDFAGAVSKEPWRFPLKGDLDVDEEGRSIGDLESPYFKRTEVGSVIPHAPDVYGLPEIEEPSFIDSVKDWWTTPIWPEEKEIRDIVIRPSDFSSPGAYLEARYPTSAGSSSGAPIPESMVPYLGPLHGSYGLEDPMVDPTFAPDASIHYSDPLKHYDTETVPGHLPLSLTTPYTTAVEGMEHAADFAPPEFSYPAMPPPSVYSRPDMEPSAPVDDFSSMLSGVDRTHRGDDFYISPDEYYISPGEGETMADVVARLPGIPSYMKADVGGTLHDTRRFGYMPPDYDWRTGTFAGGDEGPSAGGSVIPHDRSAASMSDEDRLAAALERLASIPAGFVGGPEREITYIDATGGRITPFGGVGDIGGGGTITSPLTGRGGFYAPIGMTSPVYSYTDPGLATGMGGFGDLWT